MKEAQAVLSSEAEVDRRHLLEAMAEVSVAQGYRATTIRDVADHAGLSEERFHDLFRDKEDCFVALTESTLAEVITAATEAYSADKPLVHVVRDAARAILEALSEMPAAAHLGLSDYRTANPRSRRGYESGTKVLGALLDQLRADASTDTAVPSTASRGALGGAEAVIRREVSAGRASDLPQLLPSVLYSCLVPFLGQEEALRQVDLVT